MALQASWLQGVRTLNRTFERNHPWALWLISESVWCISRVAWLPPNGQLSTAPLAGVWSVADVGERQLPGTLRAADPWSAGSLGLFRTSDGCPAHRANATSRAKASWGRK